jgi:oligoendopeptidase F
MRDYDSRFQRLEERLGREAAELRGDLQKRLEALEAFMRGEVESMTNRVRAENAERNQALGRIAHDLGETARGLDLKINNLDEQASKDIRDLRQQLLDQSKALSDEIREKHEQMKGAVEQESQQIRTSMTARETLADMLSEVSLRLRNEFKVTGLQ